MNNEVGLAETYRKKRLRDEASMPEMFLLSEVLQGLQKAYKTCDTVFPARGRSYESLGILIWKRQENEGRKVPPKNACGTVNIDWVFDDLKGSRGSVAVQQWIFL